MLIHANFNCLDKARENKVCLIHGNIKYTYKEFAQKVDCLAYHLATQVKKGDRVLVKLPNPVDQLLYFYAIIKAGGSSVLIDAAASETVCAELIERQQIALFINEKFQLPAAAASSLPAVTPDDIFLGALSSGSTGKPKIIWRDHHSWASAFAAQSAVFNIHGTDKLFLAGALVYTGNLNACVHMLALGGTVVIAASSRPRTWLQEMMSHHVNALFMVPAHYRLLVKTLNKPILGFKSLVSGGAKLDLATVQWLVEYFPGSGIFEYYGASELGHVSYMTAADLLARPQAVGKPFPGVKIWIEEQTIWAESPYLAPAYRPRATVGDLGRIDADGYLYVLGRKNGIVNSGGVKIIPEQVAAVINQCPGVAQAVVSGIADELKGERLCAWVVKNNPELTTAALLSFCRTRLRPHYCPQKIIFVEDLPLNTSGKIDLMWLKSNTLP